MDQIRIVVVDDMEQIVKYFSMVISMEKDMQVIDSAGTEEGAVAVCVREKPDVVLMDIQMDSPMAGIEATRRIKKSCPDTKVIILTIHDDNDIIFNAYVAGADEFLVKTASIVDIVKKIRDTHFGNDDFNCKVVKYLAGELMRVKKENNDLLRFHNMTAKLTEAEFDILKLVYEGYKYKQIAEMRHVEEVTVRTQANKILKKTGAKSIKNIIKVLREMNAFKDMDE